MAFCTECGFKLPDRASFCPNCGYRLSEQKSEVEPPQAAADHVSGGQSEEPDDIDSSGGDARSYYQRPDTGYYPPSGGPDLGYSRAQSEKNSNSKTVIILIVSVLVLLVVAVVLIMQYAGSSRVAVSASPSHNTVAGSGYVENGDYYISFIGAEQFTDIDNDPAIRIYYEFTNHFSYPQSAWYCLDWTVTQDGRKLEQAYCWDDVEVYYYDTLAVRNGITIACCLQFKYNPSGGKVDLSIFGWSSGESGGKASCTYVPGSLPGAPAPYKFEIISEPQWTLKLDSEGDLDDGKWYAAVTDAKLVNDCYGEAAVRVYYEFTNYTHDYICMYDALNLLTYQDGVELYKTYAEVDSETDENLFLEVGYGETTAASCLFRLRNNSSNIEAEVEAAGSYHAIGQTYKVRY